MSLQRLFRALVLGTVPMLVIAACGSPAAPTATPPSAATPVPTKAAVGSPVPASSPAPITSNALPTGTGYPPEMVKAFLAQNMYLPGMSLGANETPQYGGQASYSNKAPLPNDDITTTSSITMINVLGSMVSDGNLVKLKRTNNNEYAGNIVEAWSVSSDNKVWTFKMRPNVKWHDGKPVTAEDAKFWIDLTVFPPKGRTQGGPANALPYLQAAKVVDPMTLELIFKQPSPYLLESFAATTGNMVHPKHLAQPELDKGNNTVSPSQFGWVAFGPFKFDHYERGSSFRTVRFDQYWEKDDAGRSLPYLDSVYNVFIPDRTVALGAFRAGRLDSTPRGVGSSLDPDMLASVNKTLPGKAWFHRYAYNNYGIDMNAMKAPFNDIRARKAVFLYMDRAEGAQKMQAGFAFSSGFTSPTSAWHSGQYNNWPGYRQDTKAQDKAEAKRLMKEAGLVGSPLTINCRNDYLYMCEFSEAQLRAVGFDPKIILEDVNTSVTTGRTLQFQVVMGTLYNGLFPGAALETWVTTAITNRFNDTKIDAYQDIILTSSDPQVRRQALWDAEKYVLLEQAYKSPFLREETVQGYRTYLKGSVVPGYQPHTNTDRSTDWIDKSLR